MSGFTDCIDTNHFNSIRKPKNERIDSDSGSNSTQSIYTNWMIKQNLRLIQIHRIIYENPKIFQKKKKHIKNSITWLNYQHTHIYGSCVFFYFVFSFIVFFFSIEMYKYINAKYWNCWLFRRCVSIETAFQSGCLLDFCACVALQTILNMQIEVCAHWKRYCRVLHSQNCHKQWPLTAAVDSNSIGTAPQQYGQQIQCSVQMNYEIQIPRKNSKINM